jgi:hypothetical protein
MSHMGHEMEEALGRAASTLEAAGIPYALMGGLASAAVGRARATRDVDFFLPAETAEAALDALADAGFETERTDPAWLFKAFWRGVLVDLIFRSKGGVRFDAEMAARRRRITVGDTQVPALAPEDILVIKALANAEHVSRHWHDALGIVAANEIDWDYLLWRAQGHPYRVLSLLAYAASDGLPVPGRVLRSLHEIGEELGPSGSPRPAEDAASRTADRDQVAARVREALATDGGAGEPHLRVEVHGDLVTLEGTVATADRRHAAAAVAGDAAPGYRIECRVQVVP